LGHFNPALRIVAMDGSVDRLNEIAEAIHVAAPAFTLRLIERNRAK
jgi:hypothetical protein